MNLSANSIIRITFVVVIIIFVRGEHTESNGRRLIDIEVKTARIDFDHRFDIFIGVLVFAHNQNGQGCYLVIRRESSKHRIAREIVISSKFDGKVGLDFVRLRNRLNMERDRTVDIIEQKLFMKGKGIFQWQHKKKNDSPHECFDIVYRLTDPFFVCLRAILFFACVSVCVCVIGEVEWVMKARWRSNAGAKCFVSIVEFKRDRVWVEMGKSSAHCSSAQEATAIIRFDSNLSLSILRDRRWDAPLWQHRESMANTRFHR